ncbi:MAG: hypothetical protein QXH64_02860 [Nitrososphaeria archaeon]
MPAFEILYTAMDKNVGHFRRYSMKHLGNLLSDAGFIIKESFYVDSLGFLITLLFKVLGNKEGKINQRELMIYDKYLFPISVFFDKTFKKILGKNICIFATKPFKKNGSI